METRHSHLKRLYETGSEDDLLLEIGYRISENDHFALPPGTDRLRKNALRWIESIKHKYIKVICRDEKIHGLAEDGYSFALVSAVLALLESIAIGTAASPLAVLICKRGIQKLCAEEWKVSGFQGS